MKNDVFLETLKARKDKALLLLKKNPSNMGLVQYNKFQKINKQICLLENLSFMIDSAPRTMDMEKIKAHFEAIKGFFQNEFNKKIDMNISVENVYSYVRYLQQLYLNIEKTFNKEN